MSWRERWERSKGTVAILHYIAAILLMVAGFVALFGPFGIEATRGDAALLLVLSLFAKESADGFRREFEEYVKMVSQP